MVGIVPLYYSTTGIVLAPCRSRKLTALQRWRWGREFLYYHLFSWR